MKAYTRRQYTAEFKREAVELVIRENYTVAQAASSLGISRSMLDHLRREYRVSSLRDEAEELARLREGNRVDNQQNGTFCGPKSFIVSSSLS